MRHYKFRRVLVDFFVLKTYKAKNMCYIISLQILLFFTLQKPLVCPSTNYFLTVEVYRFFLIFEISTVTSIRQYF